MHMAQGTLRRCSLVVDGLVCRHVSNVHDCDGVYIALLTIARKRCRQVHFTREVALGADGTIATKLLIEERRGRVGTDAWDALHRALI